MRPLTFEGYLTSYVEALAGERTHRRRLGGALLAADENAADARIYRVQQQ